MSRSTCRISSEGTHRKGGGKHRRGGGEAQKGGGGL